MKGPSLSRHTSAERARAAHTPFRSHAISRRAPGRTVHHCMSERLTFSFSHLFELARELSISLDQDGRHSQNDRLAVMAKRDDTILERTSHDRRPRSKDLVTQDARERDARFQGALTH